MADDRVVVADGGSSGVSLILGIVLGLLVLLGVLYFSGAFGRMLGGHDTHVDVKIEKPASAPAQ